MADGYKAATQQTTSDAYPHYLAVMENGPSMIINVLAVRMRPDPSQLEDSDRVVVESEGRDSVIDVNRRRLRTSVGEAIAALAADITAENRGSFESSLENGNRDLFESMARLTSQYVEGAIDAAWCQMKAERLALAQLESEADKAKMLEVARQYVENRLRPFGEHLANAIEHSCRSHCDLLYVGLSERMNTIEGQLKLMAEILTPLARLKAAKPKSAKKASKPKRKR